MNDSSASDRTARSDSELAFESILARLHDVVRELESGELPLERSLELFEEGVRLAGLGGERLDRAEARVEELLAVTENGVRTRPLDAEDSSRVPTPSAADRQLPPREKR